MQRYGVRKAMQKLIDELEPECENTQDYYCLNSASSAQFYELEDLLVKWLESIGVKFIV
jgi:RecJ-like exonuclease